MSLRGESTEARRRKKNQNRPNLIDHRAACTDLSFDPIASDSVGVIPSPKQQPRLIELADHSLPSLLSIIILDRSVAHSGHTSSYIGTSKAQ